MILHNLTPDEIKRLMQRFAYLTEQGWKIPDWCYELEKYQNLKGISYGETN